MRLNGTVGILTGSSRGIGVYLAEALARRGVRLALAARSKDELNEVAERVQSFGADAIAIPTDVARREDLEALVERTTAELGPPDVLVNNAGIERYADFHSYEVDMIEKIIRVNLVAAEVLTRLVVPGMIDRARGHIVNISSVAGKSAVPYNAVYSSSKHALVGFSWSLRQELKPYGVGVSVVCPGFVRAGMFADWSGGVEPPGMTRSVSPERVANATVEAIERDKADVVVGSALLRFSDVLHAVSPSLAGWIGRKSGAYRFLRSATDKTFRD
jgi:short-subunit dehydrogenase